MFAFNHPLPLYATARQGVWPPRVLNHHDSNAPPRHIPAMRRDIGTDPHDAPRPGMFANAPVFIRKDFLDETTADALLDYALAHREAFRSTRVGIKDRARTDPQNRISLAMRDLGEFRQVLDDRVTAGLPEMLASLPMTPISIAKIEMELVAHGDGAFYGRHIDPNPHGEADTIRALSGVYYFHARPRAFSGGQLRLYPSASGAIDKFIDVDPTHNSFAVFPSWVTHEVMPVRCPSNQFEDSRFSVNCWVRVARKPG